MKVMLDNPVERAEGHRGSRRYLVGDVPSLTGGAHVVVVTLLPDVANNSAAARAAILLERFRSVRQVLMVGIAGAAPNPEKADEHVRLGDIVVSGRQGVVQYDYVAERLQEIAHRAPPRPPCAELLEAVRFLEVEEEFGNRPWLSHLSRAHQLRDVARPAESEDVLSVRPPAGGLLEHPNDPKRTSGIPRVFVGPIGSANTLLRNAEKRDRMRDKFGLRAFEMEGSGIADANWLQDSGYLVVRGICDYCDESKNDRWHGYAAVVAASYMRALLASIPDRPQADATGVGFGIGGARWPREHDLLERVAETYRLLSYGVERDREFGGRSVQLFCRKLRDTFHRVVECIPASATLADVDALAAKMRLVRSEFPSAIGTIITSAASSGDVSAQARREGIELITADHLHSRVLDGVSYSQRLIRDLSSNDKYQPRRHVQPFLSYDVDGEAMPAERMVGNWLEDLKHNQLTVLGDVGTGKTFLSRMLALHLAEAHVAAPIVTPFPVLIELRNAERLGTLEALVTSHLGRSGLENVTYSLFEEALRAGRIVLILDGFDEMAARIAPHIATRNFHELIQCVSQKAKVLLTSRTHFFKSRGDEEQVLLGAPGDFAAGPERDLYHELAGRKGFKIAYLRPFEQSQIQEYVELARPEDSERVIEQMRETYDLMELSRRPLLLDLIVRSLKHDGREPGDRTSPLVQEYPDRRAASAGSLYNVFTNLWVQRDQWRDTVSSDRKRATLTALAMELWISGAKNLHHNRLFDYVKNSGDGLSAEAAVELDAELRTASFLIRDGSGNYEFAHKSFGEFFVARYLAAELNSGNVACLSQKLLSMEIQTFLIDLVKDALQVDTALATVLTDGYRAILSENAFRCLCRLRQEEAGGREDEDVRVVLPERIRLEGARLDGVELRRITANDIVLRSASLRGANIVECELARGDFTEADLRDAKLQRTDLRRSRFVRANLQQADLTGSNIEHVEFTGSSGRRTLYEVIRTHDELERLREVVRSTARRIATTTTIDADDLEQEVMTRLLEIDMTELRVPLEAYVKQVCARTAVRWYERDRARRHVSDERLKRMPDERDPRKPAFDAELIRRLESAVDDLGKKERALIHDYYYQRRSIDMLAQTGRIHRATVARQLGNITSKLRKSPIWDDVAWYFENE